MGLSWISNRSLRVSPRVRLVDNSESDALRRKLDSVDWKPANGFLRDQVQERPYPGAVRGSRAA